MSHQHLEMLVSLVKPTWQDDFFRFTNFGEASPSFLRFLDSDKDCQTALKLETDRQRTQREDISKRLRILERHIKIGE